MHIHYVAFSRVKTLQDLCILNFDPKKILVSKDVKFEMKCLREKPFPFKLAFPYNIESQLKIAYLNAQSLHRHLLDVQHDHSLSSVDIWICAETQFLPTDAESTTKLDGFKSFRNDALPSTTGIPYHGLAAYFKTDPSNYHPVIIANRNGIEIIVSHATLLSGDRYPLIIQHSMFEQ